ncbi:FxSxx-COOH cyclophane-containing RiPP peptide [Streptomyces sp. NPDC093099]|uniref:FxSxx-COOH cyclophane-containing RiPP peptide n=1 Tax=Streptomyces sp. NPDC093099 TaxID=3366028 RepID=UPI0038032271
MDELARTAHTTDAAYTAHTAHTAHTTDARADAGMADATCTTGVGAPDGPGGLPDLLALDLETLRTLDHPVLAEVVADLRDRAEQPREMLWGFTNAF